MKSSNSSKQIAQQLKKILELAGADAVNRRAYFMDALIDEQQDGLLEEVIGECFDESPHAFSVVKEEYDSVSCAISSKEEGTLILLSIPILIDSQDRLTLNAPLNPIQVKRLEQSIKGEQTVFYLEPNWWSYGELVQMPLVAYRHLSFCMATQVAHQWPTPQYPALPSESEQRWPHMRYLLLVAQNKSSEDDLVLQISNFGKELKSMFPAIQWVGEPDFLNRNLVKGQQVHMAHAIASLVQEIKEFTFNLNTTAWTLSFHRTSQLYVSVRLGIRQKYDLNPLMMVYWSIPLEGYGLSKDLLKTQLVAAVGQTQLHCIEELIEERAGLGTRPEFPLHPMQSTAISLPTVISNKNIH